MGNFNSYPCPFCSYERGYGTGVIALFFFRTERRWVRLLGQDLSRVS